MHYKNQLKQDYNTPDSIKNLSNIFFLSTFRAV